MDLQSILSIIGGAAGLVGIGGGKAAVRFVSEGNRAVVTRFGKARKIKKGPHAGEYKVLEPG